MKIGYIADDGTIFENQTECYIYEFNQNETCKIFEQIIYLKKVWEGNKRKYIRIPITQVKDFEYEDFIYVPNQKCLESLKYLNLFHYTNIKIGVNFYFEDMDDPDPAFSCWNGESFYTNLKEKIDDLNHIKDLYLTGSTIIAEIISNETKNFMEEKHES